MKLEYKLKDSNDVISTIIEVSERPDISILVDGVAVLFLCGLDIESINITELIKDL